MGQLDFLAIPKTVLHDHLDGGVRPETLLSLANSCGMMLPVSTSADLSDLITSCANSGSLERYLTAFSWTVPAMQTASALRRVAFEAVEDLASDGVVLAEIRFAPFLHTNSGLTPQEAIDAVVCGIRDASEDTGVPVGLILCGMRHKNEFSDVVDLYRANGKNLVVGVDLAGPEYGFPVEKHLGLGCFNRQGDAPITIHAGEADGVNSIVRSIDCGARRIGHGTRLIDDIDGEGYALGLVLQRRIHVEVCLSSNVHTGAVSSLQAHPLRRFIDEGVRVSLDTDNRLMSATMPSNEYRIAHEVHGLSKADLLKITTDSILASFLPLRQRLRALDLVDSRASHAV